MPQAGDPLAVIQRPQVHFLVAQAPAGGRGALDHDLDSDLAVAGEDVEHPEVADAELADAAAGKLDAGAAAAVIEAAGLPRPRSAWPCDLTDREVDVLRLCARGMTNREIAATLVVSDRTVQHHLASIYDKTGRRTRAGAAVFAVEHGLAGWPAG